MMRRRALSSEAHAHIKKLGYARSKRVRMYGEEFEIVSDPFIEDDAVAIEVITRTDRQLRVLHLPVMVTQSLHEEKFAKAA